MDMSRWQVSIVAASQFLSCLPLCFQCGTLSCLSWVHVSCWFYFLPFVANAPELEMENQAQARLNEVKKVTDASERGRGLRGCRHRNGAGVARDDGTSTATPATPQKPKVLLPCEESASARRGRPLKMTARLRRSSSAPPGALAPRKHVRVCGLRALRFILFDSKSSTVAAVYVPVPGPSIIEKGTSLAVL